MCIVIAKVATAKPPTEEVLRRCWTSNPHGAGFAFVNTDGGVTIRKGYMKVEELLEALKPVLEVTGASYLIHFRIATHGTKDAENTHPFFAVNEKVAVAHNGILPYSRLVSPGMGRSDTNAFTEDILAKLPDGWYDDAAWRHVIEEYMGGGNKIAVLSEKGIKLLNRSGWTEETETGLFYSNTGFRAYRTPKAGYGYTGCYGEDDEFGGRTYTHHRSHAIHTPSTSQSGSNLVKTPETTTESKFTSEQKKAYNRVCSRMHFVKRRGCMTDPEIDGIKEAMKTGFMDPEHVECGIDMLWEAMLEVPATNLSDIQILMGATSYGDLFKKCHAMQLSTEAHDETTKIEKPVKSVIDVTKWNPTNAQRFVGKACRIDLEPSTSTVGNHSRLVEVTSVNADTLEYKRLGVSATGKISWTIINRIEEAMAFVTPEAADLKKIIGMAIYVESKEGSPLTGTLQSVDSVNNKFSLRLISAAVVTEDISKVIRVVSLDSRALSEAMISRASGK